MRSYKIKGIVIKRINIGEADRIVTVFTDYYGKVQVRASGVRRIISKRSPHIELLNYSALTLHHGKNLPILTEATTLQDFSEIKEDLARIGFAYHICELVDGLCPDGQENQKAFSLLYSALMKLSQYDDILAIVHDFEIQLLIHLGYFKYSTTNSSFNTISFIEQILERKLKSRQILHHLK